MQEPIYDKSKIVLEGLDRTLKDLSTLTENRETFTSGMKAFFKEKIENIRAAIREFLSKPIEMPEKAVSKMLYQMNALLTFSEMNGYNMNVFRNSLDYFYALLGLPLLERPQIDHDDECNRRKITLECLQGSWDNLNDNDTIDYRCEE